MCHYLVFLLHKAIFNHFKANPLVFHLALSGQLNLLLSENFCPCRHCHEYRHTCWFLSSPLKKVNFFQLNLVYCTLCKCAFIYMESYLLLALYGFYHPMLFFKINSGHVKHDQLFHSYICLFLCVRG